MKKTEYVTEPSKFYKILLNEKIDDLNIQFINEDMVPWVPEVFFSLGATELSGEAAKSSPRSGEKKTSGTNG